jgi:hypothetical protein
MTIADFLFSVEPEPVREKTETDTFDALRRIPREKLEADHRNACHSIASNEKQHVIEDEINAEDPIGLHSCMDVTILDMLHGREFVGTGWTVKEYADLCYQEAKDARNQLKKKKRLCKFYMALTLVIAGASSAIMMPYLSGFLMKTAMPILDGWMWGRVYIAIRKRILGESV